MSRSHKMFVKYIAFFFGGGAIVESVFLRSDYHVCAAFVEIEPDGSETLGVCPLPCVALLFCI